MTAKRKRRFTDEDYAEMAASYEAEPIRPDEVRSIEIGPGLPKGQPAEGSAAGETPGSNKE
ncbi:MULTISPECIES: hypothetical protein [Mycobacterium]|uniref:hypothetical protein n=1 Tax=Mycobacterium TaxID=1763 RepID=UPI0007A02C29|nr:MULTISPECIES: hypothetical protein [Mycobacterium]MCV7100904.1 hypothetical protein [Mycobacterium palustre]MDV3215719.1 hypothetical protein [Mycobacterium avium]